jgi:hypothetical protein
MTVNPYMPPSSVYSPPHVQDVLAHGTVTRPVLIGMCAAIAGITCVSVSLGVPTLVSPLPLLVIVPVFNGIQAPVVAVLIAASFAITHFRHVKGIPRPKPHFGFTVLLAMTTCLTAIVLITDWSYSIGYHGRLYTIGVSIANLLCAAIVWSTWWASRTVGRYRMQVVFGFSLFAWLVSYALPYTGELP